jgi:excisionase family DNA binding protein
MTRYDLEQAPLLKVKEVARRLAIHPSTVKRLIRRGELVGYRVNTRGDWRVTPEDVAAYLDRVSRL